MENKLLFCQNCRTNNEPIFCGYWGSGYSSKFGKTCTICKCCELTELDFSSEDYWVIRHTSKDIHFLEAMIKLHDEDIIEYESRMSQFRTNDPWYQEKHGLSKSSEQNNTDSTPQENNQVHCPYCNSTNVQKISTSSRAGSVMMFGIFSKKIGKQWHCKNCKSDF